jgi:hypothetical protein
MHCLKCSTPFTDGTRYCGSCGARLSEFGSVDPPPAAASHRYWLIGGALLGLVIVVVLTALYLPQRNQPQALAPPAAPVARQAQSIALDEHEAAAERQALDAAIAREEAAARARISKD